MPKSARPPGSRVPRRRSRPCPSRRTGCRPRCSAPSSSGAPRSCSLCRPASSRGSSAAGAAAARRRNGSCRRSSARSLLVESARDAATTEERREALEALAFELDAAKARRSGRARRVRSPGRRGRPAPERMTALVERRQELRCGLPLAPRRSRPPEPRRSGRRRAPVVRAALGARARGRVRARVPRSAEHRPRRAPLVPSGTTGMLVLDLSASVYEDAFGQTIRKLARAGRGDRRRRLLRRRLRAPPAGNARPRAAAAAALLQPAGRELDRDAAGRPVAGLPRRHDGSRRGSRSRTRRWSARARARARSSSSATSRCSRTRSCGSATSLPTCAPRRRSPADRPALPDPREVRPHQADRRRVVVPAGVVAGLARRGARGPEPRATRRRGRSSRIGAVLVAAARGERGRALATGAAAMRRRWAIRDRRGPRRARSRLVLALLARRRPARPARARRRRRALPGGTAVQARSLERSRLPAGHARASACSASATTSPRARRSRSSPSSTPRGADRRPRAGRASRTRAARGHPARQGRAPSRRWRSRHLNLFGVLTMSRCSTSGP